MVVVVNEEAAETLDQIAGDISTMKIGNKDISQAILRKFAAEYEADEAVFGLVKRFFEGLIFDAARIEITRVQALRL